MQYIKSKDIFEVLSESFSVVDSFQRNIKNSSILTVDQKNMLIKDLYHGAVQKMVDVINYKENTMSETSTLQNTEQNVSENQNEGSAGMKVNQMALLGEVIEHLEDTKSSLTEFLNEMEQQRRENEKNVKTLETLNLDDTLEKIKRISKISEDTINDVKSDYKMSLKEVKTLKSDIENLTKQFSQDLMDFSSDLRETDGKKKFLQYGASILACVNTFLFIVFLIIGFFIK